MTTYRSTCRLAQRVPAHGVRHIAKMLMLMGMAVHQAPRDFDMDVQLTTRPCHVFG